MPGDLTQKWQWLTPQELSRDTEWWDIYQNSFPVIEQDSKQQLLHALEKGAAIIGAYKQQGNTLGMVVFYPIHTHQAPPFIFLNYFAIAKQARSHGLGGRLLSLVIEYTKAIACPNGARYTALVWEIEDPQDATHDTERQLRQRRLEFYQREGAQLFNSHFIQPPIDGENTVNMRLMYCLLENYQIHPHEKSITEAIYFAKYRPINNISPEILYQLLDHIFA